MREQHRRTRCGLGSVAVRATISDLGRVYAGNSCCARRSGTGSGLAGRRAEVRARDANALFDWAWSGDGERLAALGPEDLAELRGDRDGGQPVLRGRPRTAARGVRQRGKGGKPGVDRRRQPDVRAGRFLRNYFSHGGGEQQRRFDTAFADADRAHYEFGAGRRRTAETEPAAGGDETAAFATAAGFGAGKHAGSCGERDGCGPRAAAGKRRDGQTESAAGAEERRAPAAAGKSFAEPDGDSTGDETAFAGDYRGPGTSRRGPAIGAEHSGAAAAGGGGDPVICDAAGEHDGIGGEHTARGRDWRAVSRFAASSGVFSVGPADSGRAGGGRGEHHR